MKKIHLGVFEMNAIITPTPGLWSDPNNQNYRYKDLSYWTEMVQLLEQGKFDFIFFQDGYGFPALKDTPSDTAFKHAIDIPRMDPMILISALAQSTNHLGFAVTSTTTFEPPYSNARRLASLDHYTKGRMGWNVVTGGQKGAFLNFGKDFVDHASRYDIADDYMDISYKMFEACWEDDAIRNDKENKVYTDPQKVHRIKHEGSYFRMDGYFSVEPSPQRTPVIFQAGSSGRGQEFAAKHAECIFMQAQSPEIMKAQILNTRKIGKEQFDRTPDKYKFFCSLSIVTGKTRQEAESKFARYLASQDKEAALLLYENLTGIDLSSFELEESLDNLHTEGSKTQVERFRAGAEAKKSVREAIEAYQYKGIRGFIFVGTPEEVVDRIQKLVEESDVDGFLIEPYVNLETYSDFVDLIVPELQNRGLFRQEYDVNEKTLRERLFGAGNDRLPSEHYAIRNTKGNVQV